MPILVFEIEDGSQVVAPLEGRTTIGSAEGNDIVAEREGIAPRHAEVFSGMGDVWWVRDRNTAAGTFVNGARITTHRLAPGDQLFLGSISARFLMDAAAVVGKSASQPRPAVGAPDPEVERKRRELSELSEALARARAQLETTAKEQKDRLDSLCEQAAKLEAAVGNGKQELTAVRSALESAHATMGDATKAHESRVARLKEEAAGLEADIQRKRQQLDLLAGALGDAEKVVAESKAPIGGLRENRRKQEDAARPAGGAAGRTGPVSRRGEKSSEQRRAKIEELERLEHLIADLNGKRAAAASALEHHEAGRQRAEEALRAAALQREQAQAELQKLGDERLCLVEDVRSLGEKSAAIGLEISVLETRRTELRESLNHLDRSRAEASQDLEATADKLGIAKRRHAEVLAEIDKVTASNEQLQAKAEQIAAQIRSAQSELESHTSARENLIALNSRLEGEVAATGNRLAELSGAEERLGRAREDLDRAEAERRSMVKALEEQTRRHDANERAARELEAQVAVLQEARLRAEEGMPALKAAHEEARSGFEVFRAEAEESRRALTGELERLRADVAGEQARLGELQQRNREIEESTRRIDELQAGCRAAEVEREKAEARVQVLKQACSDTQQRLVALEEAEKSAGRRVSSLGLQETKLKEDLKQLAGEQERERKRLDELRGLSESAGREGALEKERLAAKIAESRGELARLEARLARARDWSAELDRLYEKLGKMPEASPEARAAWLEIQRRRNEIAEQLPSGIQVRPQSRPTVVPRAR